jgi:SAM-dependent methyltransferase
VTPHLPLGRLRVVDIGAGTGIFAAVWPLWADASVVAVEPVAAMIAAGRAAYPTVPFVRGVAEALPLGDQGTDVVWVSAALHHFGDLDGAVNECRRVLRRGGRVLLRTYVPGRTRVDWAMEFPSRAAWEARFQTEDDLVALFGRHGFGLTEIAEVFEWSETFGQSAAWAEAMRDVDSVLTALSDDEVARGLDALRSRPDELGRLEITLAVFTRERT